MPTNNINPSRYLSLKNAAGLYGYTRDHLGLMIRRGKLKGVKLGSYYVTTDNWMAEYIKNFADPEHPIYKNKLSNKLLTEILAVGKKSRIVPVFKKDKRKAVDIAENESKILKPVSKTGFKTDFEKEILKELSELPQSLKYSIQMEKKFYANYVKKDVNFKNYVFKINPDRHYIILPLRKMEIDEREYILNKINNKIEKA